MPRQSGIAVENNFVRGLITETTALKFPTDACTETYDCVFDSTGRVTRRLGIDLEPSYTLTSITSETNEVYNEYQWYAVAGDGSRTFLVQQQASTLRFFDVSTEGSVSAGLKSFTIDLDSFLPTDSPNDPALSPCAFAQGNGKLIVVNEFLDPFVVSYNVDDDTVSTTTVTLQFRDFTGIDDGLTLIERPTESVATLKTNNPEHYYNLLNQGWHATDALSQWDAARTDMPSNVDIFQLYRASETDAFDNTKVTAQSPGNTPAPRGHFILNVADISRTTAMTDEGFTGAVVDFNRALIPGATGSVLNSFFNNTGRAFDDGTTENAANSADSSSTNICLLGKSWSTSTPLNKVVVYGSSDQGFINGANPTGLEFYLRGKTGAAPVLSNEGTLLNTTIVNDTSDESAGRTMISSDQSTAWDHVWVTFFDPALVARTWYIAELSIYTNDPQVSYQRASAVAFFAGRAWYSGIKAENLNGNIYFSQIIERDDQYGKCYQTNDPTAEDNAQLLPTDGGVIKIPEIGNVVKLFATQNSLIVIATNGVWLISGSAGAGFDATSYQVSRLSSIGTNSGLSVVDIQGFPFWWAESDIYTAQYDPNYNSYKIVPVTTNTIQSFIRDIPEFSRKYIKGTYNLDTGLAAWIYNTEDNPYVYSNALIYDTISQAMYPWTVSTGPEIRGVVTVSVGDGSTEPRTMLTTTLTSSGTKMTYSAAYQPTYTDWGSYAALTGIPADEKDYTSYFITGYRVDGQAYRFFQSNYVWVYLEDEDDASCFMRGQFDFSNSGNSGKWSTSQQIYNSSMTDRDVRHRRLKVRGKGKSLQLRFESESGKPFTIIGWVIWETSNAAA